VESGVPISLDTLDQWEAWVAIGTMTLALVTGTLAGATLWTAKQTRRLAGTTEDELKAVRDQIEIGREEVAAVKEQADVARQQVEISAAAMQAGNRPLLVDVPLGVYVETEPYTSFHEQRYRRVDRGRLEVWFQQETDFTIAIPLRNSGTGLALIERVSVRAGEDGAEVEGEASGTAVVPGELTILSFALPSLAAPPDRLWVEATYTDLVGSQRTRSRAEVVPSETAPAVTVGRQGWRVKRVFLFHGDDDEPFSQSGPTEVLPGDNGLVADPDE
jgi:hypothetical protein